MRTERDVKGKRVRREREVGCHDTRRRGPSRREGLGPEDGLKD